ncbi:MAG: NAD(P)H-dependent oxidoreductase subunit E [Clostridia bacterium]|nr:NAD(P)H-dependent oxidoreductase subunit E [Clostridia bacterium]
MAHLQEAAVKQINAICDRYKEEKTPLMMILSDIQKEYGYIPLEVQELVSARTGISVAEIYGVVTFYSFFSLKPKGKYVIGCCLGTACYVKGAQQVIDKFSEILKINPGETTEDGLFTLDALRCIGACGIAPAVQINGKVYPKVTVDAVGKMIAEYKAEGNA